MDEPPRWLRQLAVEQNLLKQLRILDEGVPMVFLRYLPITKACSPCADTV